MNVFRWDETKNQKLLIERGLSFEMIVEYIQAGFLLDDITHPNQDKYPHQKMLVVNVNKYVCLVPYIEKENELFLKTIIPSRKATKIYLGEKHG